jgi:hypothetical protein
MAKACVGAVDKDIMVKMYLGTVCIRKGPGTLRLQGQWFGMKNR